MASPLKSQRPYQAPPNSQERPDLKNGQKKLKPLPVKPAAPPETTPGLWGNFKNAFNTKKDAFVAKTAASILIKFGPKENDEKFLTALFNLEDSNQLKKVLKENGGELTSIIQNFIPLDSENEEEQVSQIALFHILANIASSVYPTQAKQYFNEGVIQHQVTLDQFTQDATIHICETLAKGINTINEKVDGGASLDPELFEEHLTPQILKLLLPKYSRGNKAYLLFALERKLANGNSKLISEKLFEFYVPISQWLGGEELKLPVTEKSNPLLEKLALHIADSMGNRFRKEDEKFLKRLTGKEVPELIKKFSPSVTETMKSLLPLKMKGLAEKNPEAFQNISRGVMLRILSSISKETFKDELAENKKVVIPVDKFVKQITLEFIGMFKKEFEKIDAKTGEGETIDLDDFSDLSRSLQEMILPKAPKERGKDPIGTLIERTKLRLIQEMNVYLEDIYVSAAQRDDTKIYKQRLHNVLKDSDPADAEKLVDQLYQVCSNVTNLSSGFIADIFSNPELLSNQTEALIGKQAHFSVFLSKVAAGASDLIKGDEENIAWMTDTVKNAIQVTLFKSIVHFLEKVDSKDRHPPEKLFAKAFETLLDALNTECPKVKDTIRDLSDPSSEKFVADKNLRKQSIVKAVEPLSNKLIKLFLEGDQVALADHLPVPKLAKPWLEAQIREKMPIVLAPAITAMTSWIHAMEANRAEVDGLYEDPCVSEGCRVMSAYATEAINYFMDVKAEEAGALVTKYGAFLFAAEGENLKPTDLNQISKIVEHTLKSLSAKNTEATANLFSFIQSFIEAAALRLTKDATETIVQVERDFQKDPKGSLLVQLSMIVISELKDHLQMLVKIKVENKKYRKGRISKADMESEFAKAGRLHGAIADKTFKERELFFQKAAKAMFDFINYDQNSNLPLPEFLKTPLWGFFENKLTPLILYQLFESVTDPHHLNLLLLTTFKSLNQNTSDADIQKDMKQFSDEIQIQMEQNIGDFVQALVQMQPSTVTKWLIEVKKIRKIVSRTIGQPARNHLESTSITEIIKRGLLIGLPSLHPGLWDENGKFVATKLDSAGEVVPIDGFDFSSHFPRTPEAIAQHKLLDVLHRVATGKQVVEEITDTLEKSTETIFTKIIKDAVTKFRGLLNRFIDKFFGKYAPTVKAGLNKALNFLSDYFLNPIITILTFPILYFVKKILRFYFIYQSSMRAQDVDLDIHKNALLKILDKIAKLSKNPQSSREKASADSPGTV